jgi:hypothetical protein
MEQDIDRETLRQMLIGCLVMDPEIQGVALEVLTDIWERDYQKEERAA